MIHSEEFEQIVSTSSVGTNLRSKSVRGALFMASAGGLDIVFRLATTFVLARLLLPSDFGLVGMVVAVTGIAEQLCHLGLSTATVQTRELTHRQCSNLFWANVVGGLAFGALICLAAPLLAEFYHEEKVTAVAMAISTYFLWTGLTIQHEALLNRQMRQPEISAVRATSSLTSALLGIALAFFGFGYWALVWREVARGLFLAVGVWIRFPWLPGLPSRGAGTRALFRFGRNLTLAQIFIVAIMRLDSVLVGRIAGPGLLGMYRQGQNLLVPIEVLNGPIQGVAQPGLSALQGEPDRFRRYYERVVSLVGLITIPLAVFCAIYAKEIVDVVLGPNWVGTAIFLQIAAIGAAIRPVVATSGVVLVTLGRHQMLLALSVIHSVLLGLFMVGAMPHGAVAIAAAGLLATVVLVFPKLHYSFLGSPVSMRAFVRAVSPPVLATLIMGAVLIALKRLISLDHELYTLSLGAAVASTSFLGVFVAVPGGKLILRAVSSDVINSFWHRGREVGGEAEAA